MKSASTVAHAATSPDSAAGSAAPAPAASGSAVPAGEAAAASRLPAEAGMSELCHRAPDNFDVAREILSRIGDKWSLMIIGMLEDGPRRFGALARTVPGISQRMLTHTLRNLERDGLVTRTIYAEVPPRVEYETTPLGRTLIEPALALAKWASDHQDDVLGSRDAYDGREQ